MTARFVDHVLPAGAHAGLPDPAATALGALYPCTDHDTVYRNDGAAWQTWAPLGDPATATTLADHLADAADAHDASAVSFVPAGGIAANDVQAALVELDTEKAPTGHTHAAADVSYAGSTNLAAVTVEAALDELDAEKAPLAHTHTLTLDSLTDVDLTTVPPTTGQALVWDGAQWEPGSVAAGGGGAGSTSNVVETYDSSDASTAVAIGATTTLQTAAGVVVGANDLVFVWAESQLRPGSSANIAGALSVQRGGVDRKIARFHNNASSWARMSSTLAFIEKPGAGTYSYTLVGSNDAGSGSTMTFEYRRLLVQVVSLTATAAPPTINAQTGTAYTLALGDAGNVVTLDNAAAVTLTVPLNSTVAFPIGTTIDLAQLGAGQVTIAAAGGVTVNADPGLKIAARYGVAALLKLGTDTWLAMGRLAA